MTNNSSKKIIKENFKYILLKLNSFKKIYRFR